MNQTAVSAETIDFAVRRLFETYDTNHDGKLSISQLQPLFMATLQSMGKQRRTNYIEIKEFIEKFDINHDGELDFEEMRIVFKKVLCRDSQTQGISPIFKELNYV